MPQNKIYFGEIGSCFQINRTVVVWKHHAFLLSFFFFCEETTGGLCGCLSHQCQWSLAIGGGSWVVTGSIRTRQSKVGASETRHPKAFGDCRQHAPPALVEMIGGSLCPYCALQGLCVFRWLAQAIVPSVEPCFQSAFTSLVPSPVSPLLLRHLKADVANHLPDNVEQDWDWEHPRPLRPYGSGLFWLVVPCQVRLCQKMLWICALQGTRVEEVVLHQREPPFLLQIADLR